MNILDTLLAACPLLLILILMMGLRWNGARAGMAGWLTAFIIAALRFGAGPNVLFWAQIRGLFLALYVLYIIWGALFFFRVTEAAGTLTAMRDLLQKLSPDRSFQVLILAWGFASFLQGVGGFGVPIAVVAPLLVSMGFSAVDAVILPSLGHAWAVSFGSLGSSFFALVAATGLEESYFASWMALLLGVVCFLGGFAVLWVSGQKTALRQGLPLMLWMAVAMSAVQLLAVQVGVWNIAAMLGSLAGLTIGGIWAWLQKKETAVSPPSASMLLTAILPYLILLGIIFAEKFIKPLNLFLNHCKLTVNVPEVMTTQGWITGAGPARPISVFGHPGALLFYAGLIIYGIARRQGQLTSESKRQILTGMVRSGVRSSLGILAMVGMATTMDHAGMVLQLSSAMAIAANTLFPLVSPFIGALGAFMTGSNTNSNVLFGAFQRQVADTLGYFVPVILASHNAGAALGSIFAPAKVIVGCSTVGLGGQEGNALRRLIEYGLIMIAILAILTWIIVATHI
ncbi:MAG: L-lactate permease [Anaerolineae bacterium]|nr:L-lactate permease [Anaerolineae bacterium]